MLHGALSRPFLADLRYSSAFYEDQREQSYPSSVYQLPTAEEMQRPSTPCPLDLSVRSNNQQQLALDDFEENEIEVDDEEDRRQREEARRYHHKSQLSPSSSNYSQPLIPLLVTPIHGIQHAPMTPPSTPSPPQCPSRKRSRDRDNNNSAAIPKQKKKHVRRLKFDEDTSSPVSGTVILGPDEAVVTGDIDPAFNIVEVTEEARAELAKIENRLGPYQCKLCRQLHDDAFQLAQHRCSRIAHVEYRCPECDKRFSCPANLASHRRWHKPRINANNGNNNNNSGNAGGEAATGEIACTRCEAKFTRQAALRKHLATQHPENNNNNNNIVDPVHSPGKMIRAAAGPFATPVNEAP